MGLPIIGQCLKAPVVVNHLVNRGDVQGSARQLSLHVILYDFSVALTTHKEGLRLRHIADAFLIAVRLAVSLKTLRAGILQLTAVSVYMNCHHMEPSRLRLVIYQCITVASQPGDAAVVAGRYRL